jgi:hypothetical protein
LGVESRGELKILSFVSAIFEVGISSAVAPTKNMASQADPVSIMYKNPQPLPPLRRLRYRRDRKVLLLKLTHILAFFPDIQNTSNRRIRRNRDLISPNPPIWRVLGVWKITSNMLDSF